jgi:predicted aspartyl protease
MHIPPWLWFRTTEVSIDTGFTGDLTLPTVAIELLRLTLRGRSNFRIGNGIKAFNVYAGAVQWRRVIRYVAVLESETSH